MSSQGRIRRVSVPALRARKHAEPIVVLTAYTTPFARILDPHVDMLLVGDSLGMVILGYESTIPVTMDEMIHHTKAVVRGAKHALIIGDMPFMTYHVSVEDALRNAARFMQEAGTQAVKLEGGVTVADKIKRIVDCGIPVMAHIGMTPQSINQFGGHLEKAPEKQAQEKQAPEKQAA